MKRATLLLTILLLLSLDLAWADLPGALVFDADSAVESFGVRARPAVAIVVLPAPDDVPCPICPRSSEDTVRVVGFRESAPLARPVVSRLPRARLDRSLPSEDSH